MKKEFVVPLAISTLSLLVAVGSYFLIDHKVNQAVNLTNQVNEQFSKVKPWAFKRDALDSVIDENRITAAIRGKDSSAPNKPRVREPQPAQIDRRYGDPKAQFTLIEYSDFECTFCKQFFAVPKALADGSRGNISVIFKHVPIHGDASRREAYAAECAAAQGGNDAFYRMAGAIFSSTPGNGTGTEKPLSVIAESIGLDGVELSKCMDNEDFYAKIKSDFQEAIDLGINQTPTTIVRHNVTGQQVRLDGAVTPEAIMKSLSKIVQSPGAMN
ncbi:DsbA family protein [Pseudomonas shahriarae]|uniref:DsbA family protein n=1 Tax=Pseudomonas shahriarae TaxID=2745512 RepID=A0A9X4HBN6_9PSED|nr:thioredoxin domain-containing protein [Pseudomonas shahriarae]MDD1007203.1 DsbA family protein [Pseudomonas shahriarae]